MNIHWTEPKKPSLVCETPSAGIVRLHPFQWSDDVEIEWSGSPSVAQKAKAVIWLEDEGWARAAQQDIPYDVNFSVE